MAAVFSPSEMSQTASKFFSAYASLMGTIMLIKSLANELIPQQFRSFLYAAFQYLFPPISSNLTIIIDENFGISRNQVYEAAELYLRTKISPDTERFKLGKTQKQKSFIITVDKGQKIIDFFENIRLTWSFDSVEPQNPGYGDAKRFFELSFNKKFKDRVVNSYLPHVLAKAAKIREGDKLIKIHNRNCPAGDDDRGIWGSMNLEHPATFDTIAMDPEQKKMIIDDLERFMRRRDFYKRVGKAWKRGYLLHGPPGTGKSSLIAAIANYLKFDIYDVDLASIYSDWDLINVLLSTTNRSILVIEDIDCNNQVQDREMSNDQNNSKLTLSGLLNFIDGLWSTCGDERIIIFTTNHKDRLDPALLRPGRMDVHINMSYCSANAFGVLASNYLGISNGSAHPLFDEINGLIESAKVTPAEVAEELMKSDDIDVVLPGLVSFLKRKMANQGNENIKKEGCEDDFEVEEAAKRMKTGDDEKIIGRSKRRKAKQKKRK